MVSVTIDVRGLSCPQPVLLVQKEIEKKETEITVTADEAVARDNVKRLAENHGYRVDILEEAESIVLTLRK
jgi:TusA-related sulfurtransferase